MFLYYFYLATVFLLLALAIVHFYKTRSIYSILIVIYIFWPSVFKYVCKHSTISILDINSVAVFLTAEKLVSLLLMVPFFLYVIKKELEKSRDRKSAESGTHTSP
jgi:hypothetical protein